MSYIMGGPCHHEKCTFCKTLIPLYTLEIFIKHVDQLPGYKLLYRLALFLVTPSAPTEPTLNSTILGALDGGFLHHMSIVRNDPVRYLKEKLF